MADAAGQVYTGTKHFKDRHFDGVVFIEGSGSKVYFMDVTINGILACDGAVKLAVDNLGFFKIHSDENVCEKVAILAPDSNLFVSPSAMIDVYGMTLLSLADFQGSGTFTGPLVIKQDLLALPDSFLYCQFPTYMKEFFNTLSIWNELKVVELEYQEY